MHRHNTGLHSRPLLYDIYISPLHDLTELDMFTDDNFPIVTGKKHRGHQIKLQSQNRTYC